MLVADARGQRCEEQLSRLNGSRLFFLNTCQKVFLIISLCKYSMLPVFFIRALKENQARRNKRAKGKEEGAFLCVRVMCEGYGGYKRSGHITMQGMNRY